MSAHTPVWVHRRPLTLRPIYAWLDSLGIRKAMPPEELHLTLATVRVPVAWRDLKLRTDVLVIPEGPKRVEIFAYTIKALRLHHPALDARKAELVDLLGPVDHPHPRHHLSLYKGGRMPPADVPFTGELAFGPEEAEEFRADGGHGIKHVKVADVLANEM